MFGKKAGETGTNAVTEPEDSSALTVDVTELDGRTLVTLTGELDGVSVPPLQDRLAYLADDQLAGDLVVDISGVTFLDSTALTLLILLHNRLASTGHQLTVTGPSPMARRVVEITKLDELLHIEPI